MSYQEEKDQKTKENVEMVSRMVNNMSFDNKGFAKLFSQEHRTLQQSFTRLCVAWLEELAKTKEGWYDLRNEDSVKLAKEFVAKIDEQFRYMSNV